jgi:hypothetical protein
MRKTSGRPKSILYLLLGIQAVLAFVLGVFGNKVAEVIEISPKLLLAFTILLMALSLSITVAIVRHETNFGDSGQLALFPPPSLGDRLARLLLNRLVTIFPLGVVAGALVGSGSVSLFPRNRFSGITLPDNINIEPYEICSFIIALISLFVISRKRKDVSLLVGYALGFAVSISGVFVVLRPQENEIYLTFLGWVVELFLLGFVVRSNTIEALYKELSALVKHLLRERSE